MTISDAAVEAGAAALALTQGFRAYSGGYMARMARAVLEAATIEIDCPGNWHGMRVGSTVCACGGTAKLRVLLAALPDNTEER